VITLPVEENSRNYKSFITLGLSNGRDFQWIEAPIGIPETSSWLAPDHKTKGLQWNDELRRRRLFFMDQKAFHRFIWSQMLPQRQGIHCAIQKDRWIYLKGPGEDCWISIIKKFKDGRLWL
jgi:hypothetical protein